MQKRTYVVCFTIWDYLSYYKTTTKKYLWRYVNFSESCRVVCSFNKTNTPPHMMQIVPNPKQDTFSDCFELLFPSFLKTRIFPDMCSFKHVKALLVLSFYTNSS